MVITGQSSDGYHKATVGRSSQSSRRTVITGQPSDGHHRAAVGRSFAATTSRTRGTGAAKPLQKIGDAEIMLETMKRKVD